MSKSTKPISQQVADVIDRAAENGTKETFAQDLVALGSLAKLDRTRESSSIKGALKRLLGKITADSAGREAANCLGIVGEYVKNFGKDLNYNAAVEEHKRALNLREKTTLDNQLVRLNSHNSDVGSVAYKSSPSEDLRSLSKSELQDQLAELRDKLAAQAEAEAKKKQDPLGAMLDEFIADMNDDLVLNSKTFIKKIQGLYGEDATKKQAILQDPRIGEVLKVAFEKGYPKIVIAYRANFGEDKNYQVAVAALQEQFNAATTQDQEANAKSGKERGVEKAFRFRDAFVEKVEKAFGGDVSNVFMAQVDKAASELEERFEARANEREAKIESERSAMYAGVIEGYKRDNAILAAKRAEEERKAAAKEEELVSLALTDTYNGPNDNFEPESDDDLDPPKIMAAQKTRKPVISESAQKLLQGIKDREARKTAAALAVKAEQGSQRVRAIETRSASIKALPDFKKITPEEERAQDAARERAAIAAFAAGGSRASGGTIRREVPLAASLKTGVAAPNSATDYGLQGPRGSVSAKYLPGSNKMRSSAEYDSGQGSSRGSSAEDLSAAAVDSGAKNNSRRISFDAGEKQTPERLKSSRGPKNPGNGIVSRGTVRRLTSTSLGGGLQGNETPRAQ